MSPLAVPRPTLRTLRPDALAYVDPHFPVDRLWSTLAQPVHTVERGEDVELTGELALVGQESLFTGQQVSGTYQTFWFTGDEVSGVTLLAQGATPVGAIGGGFCRAGDESISITTREGLGLLSSGSQPEGRAYLRGEGTTLINLPIEAPGSDSDDDPDSDDPDSDESGGEDLDDVPELVTIDFLLDARHQPCGFIINGDLDLTPWESRILPEETTRVSSLQLLTELQGTDPKARPVVVSRSSGFLGRAKTRTLGHVGDLDLGRAWNFSVVPPPAALTASELIDLFTDPIFRVGADLGVEADLPDPVWVTGIQREHGNLQLIVSDVLLPDHSL
ncbi:hypothetical protein FNH13_07560 [Ornithinimicrobium ciconiae]|uniref:Uncharacterized protein n=1 Tax=Ornithinimicrobium ciconiae TaxID=2594265 RepID=A0A516G9L8_9MICO|nr:hypothetical protein [Ornithinimicrobium ciconiae]QDO88218.1 hypothetical protein FNH13_07560 [Ornithinimicrobium ciconiae]